MFIKIYRMFIFTLGAIIKNGTSWTSHTLPSTENTMGVAHAYFPPQYSHFREESRE